MPQISISKPEHVIQYRQGTPLVQAQTRHYVWSNADPVLRKSAVRFFNDRELPGLLLETAISFDLGFQISTSIVS